MVQEVLINATCRRAALAEVKQYRACGGVRTRPYGFSEREGLGARGGVVPRPYGFNGREELGSRVRYRVSQPCSSTMGPKSVAGGNPGAASVEARMTEWALQGTEEGQGGAQGIRR